MISAIVWDMDGTIADLYGVSDWLPKLRNNDPSPYADAKPLYNMNQLSSLVSALQEKGIPQVICTWLAKDSNKEYKEKTREAKKEWLHKYSFKADKIHMVQYGTNKSKVVRYLKDSGEVLLIDDSKDVRESWSLGPTADPAQVDIITLLQEILERN